MAFEDAARASARAGELEAAQAALDASRAAAGAIPDALERGWAERDLAEDQAALDRARSAPPRKNFPVLPEPPKPPSSSGGPGPDPNPGIPARYGIPLRYGDRPLQYPDFKLAQNMRQDFGVPNSPAPWSVWQFDFSHPPSYGNFHFSSERTANARRFDVAGKIYVAEMFSTTAGVIPGTGQAGRPLADGEIVVWDRASAERDNPVLAKVWQREQSDPAEETFPQNAYVDGREVVPFGNFTRLDPLPKAVRLADERGGPSLEEPTAAGQYGKPARLDLGLVRYPDFDLRWLDRQTAPGTEGARFGGSWESYQWVDRLTREKMPAFTFENSGDYNGVSFRIQGKVYFAEEGWTTAGTTAGTRKALPDSTLVIWDEASARAANPRILSAWTESKAGGRFSGGVALGTMFTGTYLFQLDGDHVQGTDLDRPLPPLRRGTFAYPEVFRGSGYVGRVGGSFEINPDGTLSSVLAGFGNDTRFQDPVQQYLAQWSFPPPRMQGRPVSVGLGFSAIILDDGEFQIQLGQADAK